MQLDVALVKRLGAGFFGGEGFILEKLTGPGTVFIHGGGDFVEFKPRWAGAAGRYGLHRRLRRIRQYDIQMVGGIKTAIFGGEGLFMATLTGPGRVIVQSMTLERLRRELAPQSRGGDEHSPLGSFGIFGAKIEIVTRLVLTVR